MDLPETPTPGPAPEPGRKPVPKPGVGIATCVLALVVLSMLGYAVLRRYGDRSTPPAASNQADSAPTPAGSAATLSGSVAMGADPAPMAADAVGTLQTWPAIDPAWIEPPGYAAPYQQPPPRASFRLPAVDRSPSMAVQGPAMQGLTVQGPAIHAPAPQSTPDGFDLADTGHIDRLQPEAPPAAAAEPTPLASETPDASDPGPVLYAPAGDALGLEPGAPQPDWVDDHPDREALIATAPPRSPASASGDASGDATPPAGVASNGPVGGSLFLAPVNSPAAPGPPADPAVELARNATGAELMLDSPAPGRIAQLVAPDVREAFMLGRHGALYAAKSRFVAVLGKVARAKDAEQATDRHTADLRAGLMAIEEAVQFTSPRGLVEARLDVEQVAASHATPLYHSDDGGGGDRATRWVLPSEAIARYHRYAQHKLAAAVQGDQGGSMALHGLGKTYARLAEIDEAPLAERTSLTMYRSAVGAHPGNFLAANELGVGLARGGHYAAARDTLERAIASGAGSTTYRNLAVVQQGLGQPQLAAAATARAEQLAARERAAGEFSRQQGVQWVDRRRLASVRDAYGGRTPAAAPRGAAPRALASRPGQQRGPRLAASLGGGNNTGANAGAGYASAAPRPPQSPYPQSPFPQTASGQAEGPRPSLADRLMPWRRS
ncbi:MAG: hypothetical protein AAF790_14675, partial [Planctomycetota bacterium]